MAAHFSMAIGCNTHVSGERITTYFQPLPLLLPAGLEVPCDNSIQQDWAGGWWCGFPAL